MEKVCVKCGMDYSNPRKASAYCSISCYKKAREDNNRITINEELNDIIEGTLFSDASLELQKSNKCLNPFYVISQAVKNDEYVKYLADVFNLKDNITYYCADCKHLGYDTLSYSARFRTHASISLSSYHERWYPDFKPKEIPKDFKITPTSLFHAYLGDGYLMKKHLKRAITYIIPVFCTDSFPLENIQEVMFPQIEALGWKCGIDWHTTSRKTKNPRLYISSKNTKDFFDYIGPCPFPCFQHKWPK